VKLFSRAEVKHTPVISVVTINFNNLEPLRKTFLSVVAQTEHDFEYIIIDGGSKDGSAEFLAANNESISRWVSEPDRGIYDAMNKGANLASGEWIIFMNAGDCFYEPNTLEQILPYLVDRDDSTNRSPDIVYGEWESICDDEYGYRTKIGKPAALDIIWHQIPACHQSIFVKRELVIRYPFDTSLKWCADHDSLAHFYKLGYIFLEIPIVISKFDASGGETRDLLIYTRERWTICRKYFGRTFERELYFMNEYRSFWMQQYINKKIRNFLPKEWIVASRKLRKIY
jgi:glycosyltransferase involved in cell wall biosynthesis